MMIARLWRGSVAQADSDAYARYMQGTGVPGYVNTPGNRGVWMLRRDVDDKTEFLMFTLWDSMQAIESFAGPTPAVAVFYPEDDRYLVERESVVSHFLVETQVTADLSANGHRFSAVVATNLATVRGALNGLHLASSVGVAALQLARRVRTMEREGMV